MSDLTNKRKEKISAFLDNDMHRDELMSFSLSGEPDDAKTALRYQMMGDALRGEMSDSSFVDVSHAVREATGAVENITEQTDEHRSRATVSSAATSSAWDLSSWFRPVAGMAVAVVVAVVMVFTLSEQDAGLQTPLANNVETQPAVQLAVDKKAAEKDPHVDQRLVDQNLVNQHLEYATQDALQGRLPYVRAVSYETKK